MEAISTHYKTVKEILGEKQIKKKIESSFDFIRAADSGLNSSIIQNFREYFGFTMDDTAQMLNVSEPTLYRWGQKNKTLERNVSVKLFNLTDLFLIGIQFFNNKDLFFKWLSIPSPALGGMLPIDLMEIPGGVEKVRDLLGRLEYGVYS